MPASNGWLASRAAWHGVLGTYWNWGLRPAAQLGYPVSSWKPFVLGKNYPGMSESSRTTKAPRTSWPSIRVHSYYSRSPRSS